MSSSGHLERYGIRFAVERATSQYIAWKEAQRKAFTMNQAAEARVAAELWWQVKEEATYALAFTLTDDMDAADRNAAQVFHHCSTIGDLHADLERAHRTRPSDPVVGKAWESGQEGAAVAADIEKYVRARTLIQGVGP